MRKIHSVPEAEIAAAIGRITIAWNDLHYEFFLMFVAASGMPKGSADAIFFAIKNDNSHRDMTKAALLEALRPNKMRREAINLIKRAGKFAGERNLPVHAMWATHYPSGDLVLSPFVRQKSASRTGKIDVRLAETLGSVNALYREALRLQTRISKHLASRRKSRG